MPASELQARAKEEGVALLTLFSVHSSEGSQAKDQGKGKGQGEDQGKDHASLQQEL